MHVTTHVTGTAMGIDLGNRKSSACVRTDGRIVEEFEFRTEREPLIEVFQSRERCRVLLEACSVSFWVARTLEELGFDVVVADPRRIATEPRGDRKNDEKDARLLALLCERGSEFYKRVGHRSYQTMRALSLIRLRDQVVTHRTALICSVKGMCASFGAKVSGTSTAFARKAAPQIPPDLFPYFEPMLRAIDGLTNTIKDYDRKIEAVSQSQYPMTSVLRQVFAIGPITALTFILTLESPSRFKKNRQAGPYLGLVPRLGDSGDKTPQLRISKAGDRLLRRLLVQCAHLVLRSNAPDSDLRRFGLALTERGGKNAKKRAIIAVARKLSVLLLALWRSGEVYEPLRNARLRGEEILVTS